MMIQRAEVLPANTAKHPGGFIFPSSPSARCAINTPSALYKPLLTLDHTSTSPSLSLAIRACAQHTRIPHIPAVTAQQPYLHQGPPDMLHDGHFSSHRVAHKAPDPSSLSYHTPTAQAAPAPDMSPARAPAEPVLEWDWDVEHGDRKREAKADAAQHNAQPFLIDRKILKDVIREKMECEVARITFLSSGMSPRVGCRHGLTAPPSTRRRRHQAHFTR